MMQRKLCFKEGFSIFFASALTLAKVVGICMLVKF